MINALMPKEDKYEEVKEELYNKPVSYKYATICYTDGTQRFKCQNRKIKQ